MGRSNASVRAASVNAALDEALQLRCWQQFFYNILKTSEPLNGSDALPPAAEKALAGCIRQYHEDNLTVEDAKQVQH